MTLINHGRAAILYPGDLNARHQATPENNRFSEVFKALIKRGVRTEPAVYSDDFSERVYQQLLGVDAVLVWMNPIQDGRDRSILDDMLKDIARKGVFVSTHPDVIIKLGTKEVVYRTRHMEWGCDTHLYQTMEQLRQELPPRLVSGQARVLKQYRGNGGLGVWKVELAESTLAQGGINSLAALPKPDTRIKVRQAKRGSVEEKITLGNFYSRCMPYFGGQGKVIDQAYQSRLPEGMTRCYLVHDKVVGFGHQAVNMLYPAPPGTPPTQTPLPGPRLYHPPDKPDFQGIKRRLEGKWIPELRHLLGIAVENLPVLWDCDFLLGPQNSSGEDTYVLCEINASSVAPFPESALPFVADATVARISAAKKTRTQMVTPPNHGGIKRQCCKT